MNGRERIAKSIRLEPVDRTPWVPFVGVHAASLIGLDATSFLQSEDRLVEGVSKAVEMYRPDGVPVAFDLQIEAEAMGCGLNWSQDNPPAVTSHPLADGVALADLKVPAADAGRIGLVLNAARRLRQAHPDIALYGLITGPFTLALHLLGTDIFMKMFDATDEIDALMALGRDVCNAMAERYIEAGCDVVAVVDPMTSQIGPDQFRQFVTPYASAVFEHIRAQGAFGSFFVCGHAQQNVQAMCECGPDNVSVDENIPLDFVRDTCLERNVSFGGNLQLTTVLLLGTPADAEHNALECLDIGGGRGFILAPGCDLPYATPPANLTAVTKLAQDPYQQEIARARQAEPARQDLLDLSDYGQGEGVVIDIITLDSASCAPCQYMVDSVRRVMPEFEGLVQWREHKIKRPESLVLMASLGVKNIPTICIDGKPVFISRIPGLDELAEAIRDRLFEKLRHRLARKRAAVVVLGDGEAAEALRRQAERAAEELGLAVRVEQTADPATLAGYGLSDGDGPALVLRREEVRLADNADAATLKQWMKGLG